MEKPRGRSGAAFLSCRLRPARSTCRATDQLPIGEGFCFRLPPARVFRSAAWFEGEDALPAMLRHVSRGRIFLPDRCRMSDCAVGKRVRQDREARNCKPLLSAKGPSKLRDSIAFVVRWSNRSGFANRKAGPGRGRCSLRRSGQIDRMRRLQRRAPCIFRCLEAHGFREDFSESAHDIYRPRAWRPRGGFGRGRNNRGLARRG